MTLLFWLSLLMIGYVYAGYPALLAVWTRLAGRRAVRSPVADGDLPSVSIIVAARNEAHHLPARLENLLALDYPTERRQIVIVSDGSTDETVRVLDAFRSVADIVTIPPSGKAAALNAGVADARHDLLVFADARQTFARDALRALVAPFVDPEIGGVSGELVLDCEMGSEATDSIVSTGIGLYWRYEKWLRRHESAVGSLLGVTGAIYALRRSLWRPLPSDTLLDDVLAPMQSVLAGRRVILEPRAKAYDRSAPNSHVESRRKVRTIAGNVQVLWLEPRLLVPIVNPVWLQYCSHKLGRLAVPYALLALMASSMALAEQHAFYAAALAGQCAFYLLAGYGAWLEWCSTMAPQRPTQQPVAATLPWPPPCEQAHKGVVNA